MSLFDRDRSAARTPVGVITGFLGSGKTTLLNRLLADQRMAKSLVLINEFGEIGLDHLFIAARDGDLVLMQSGCVCCTVRGDLERTLREIAAKRQRGAIPPFARVLLETTGLADPAPVAGLFLNHPLVAHDYRLDAIVATVDAVNGARQLDEHAESVKQAAIADRLLLTKRDLAEGEAGAGALRARLARLNPGAPIHDVAHGEVDPALLFGAGPFDPAGKSGAARAWLAAERYADEHGHAEHGQGEHAHHDTRIASFCLTHDAPLDWDRFQRWLGLLRGLHGDELLRVKGILDVAGAAGPLVIQGVHQVFHPPVELERWPDADRRSRLVFIVRDLDRAAVEERWRELVMGESLPTPSS
jgi:G3E family GTPase